MGNSRAVLKRKLEENASEDDFQGTKVSQSIIRDRASHSSKKSKKPPREIKDKGNGKKSIRKDKPSKKHAKRTARAEDGEQEMDKNDQVGVGRSTSDDIAVDNNVIPQNPALADVKAAMSRATMDNGVVDINTDDADNLDEDIFEDNRSNSSGRGVNGAPKVNAEHTPLPKDARRGSHTSTEYSPTTSASASGDTPNSDPSSGGRRRHSKDKSKKIRPCR